MVILSQYCVGWHVVQIAQSVEKLAIKVMTILGSSPRLNAFSLNWKFFYSNDLFTDQFTVLK